MHLHRWYRPRSGARGGPPDARAVAVHQHRWHRPRSSPRGGPPDARAPNHIRRSKTRTPIESGSDCDGCTTNCAVHLGPGARPSADARHDRRDAGPAHPDTAHPDATTATAVVPASAIAGRTIQGSPVGNSRACGASATQFRRHTSRSRRHTSRSRRSNATCSRRTDAVAGGFVTGTDRQAAVGIDVPTAVFVSRTRRHAGAGFR